MIVFVAGATGAVGTVLVPLLRQKGFTVLPHVRPKTAAKHALGKDPDAQIFDITETSRLAQAVQRADAIVCLVGTMKKRFAQGDTYESSDYAPVAALVEAAQSRQYFVLLSSLGAREGGGYLGWKFKAEEVVRKSGLQHAILRPSFLAGEDRKPPPLVGGALHALGALPGLRKVSDDVRPIPIDVLCEAIAKLLHEHAQGTLTGRDLWALAARPLS